MGSETVLVDEVHFPTHLTATTKPLTLVGYGITDIEIHFLQIKFTAMGVYTEPNELKKHLQQWKGKTGEQLAEDDDFFGAIVSAPVEKVVRIVVIKEIKGSQYAVQLESAVRDRLAAEDKYEEEEAELEKVVQFFQSKAKYLKKNSIITLSFPPTSPAQIAYASEEKEKAEAKIEVVNRNVVEMIARWYLGGTRAVSPSTISSLARNLSTQLSASA